MHELFLGTVNRFGSVYYVVVSTAEEKVGESLIFNELEILIWVVGVSMMSTEIE